MQVIGDLWVEQDVPGSDQLRDFEQNYLTKVGSTSDMYVTPEIVASFPRAQRAAGEALMGVKGWPVAWTWTMRREVTPDEREGLIADDQIWLEGDTRDPVDDIQIADQENDPMRELYTGHLTLPDKKREHPEEPKSGEEIDSKQIEDGQFQIPDGYKPAPSGN